MTTAAQILNKAVAHLQDRASTYDKSSGERSMGATVAAFSAITGITLSTEQGWLFMAVLKAVRSQQGAFKADNYEDGAAYFALACEAAEIERMSMAEVSAKLQEIAKPARAEELQADDGEQSKLEEFARIHHKIYVLFEPVTSEEALLHAEITGRQGSNYFPRADNAELMDALRNTRQSNTALLHEVRSLNEMNARAAKILDALVAGGSSHVTRPVKGYGEIFEELFKDCGIEAAKPAKPADEGWIEWGGGECPVSPDAKVDVRVNSGALILGELARYLPWGMVIGSRRTVAYRLAKEQA